MILRVLIVCAAAAVGCSSGIRAGTGSDARPDTSSPGTKDAGDAAISVDTKVSDDAPLARELGSDSGTMATACVTIPAPYNSQLPRVTASGAPATAIAKALDAILAAQTPALSPGNMYVISATDCRKLDNLFNNPTGFRCEFPIQIDGRPAVKVSTGDSDDLAEALFSALVAAGGTICMDPHGTFLSTGNLTVNASGAQFEDASNYRPLLTPNVVAHGADAQSAVAAIAAAGLNDCTPTRGIFFVCTKFGQAPTCSYEWLPQEKIGSSILLATCGPGSGQPEMGGDISASSSLAIWQSLLAAAGSAGFTPDTGTLEQTTVVNAREFSWDGQNLGFTLTTGNVTGPPAPNNGNGMPSGPAGPPGPRP